MPECIIHVGAEKCGSSSLQTALSKNPFIASNDGKCYEYICIKNNGRILRGSNVTRNASKKVYGYARSSSIKYFSCQDSISRLRSEFDLIFDEGAIPILSCEGWLNAYRRFDEVELLYRLGMNAKVVAFVRPQVPWIISSWWQWGAWSNKTFSEWLSQWRSRGKWATLARKWRRINNVSEVKAIPIYGDVVKSFFAYLDATPPNECINANATLDGDLLRFLQRNPELRSGKHAAAVDFILGRFMERGSSPAPWVLNRKQVKELVEFYMNDNLSLLQTLDTASKIEVCGDPRWWDANAFSEKHVESPDASRPNAEELEQLAVKAISAILKLNEKAGL